MAKCIATSIYIHYPFCVKKCPYCDFNSHTKNRESLNNAYFHALKEDLITQQKQFGPKKISSIFFGGGTPSLMPPSHVESILEAISKQYDVAADCETTLEANPGTFDLQSFKDFHSAGINRLSIGVQSFNNQSLQSIGRIHDKSHAIQAIEAALSLPFKSINCDIMYGLPNQSITDAMQDLEQATKLNPHHISWYELTIEPNTYFHRFPPKRPSDELRDQIETQGLKWLKKHGYQRYEISGFSQPGHMCQHNRNYWLFGDYLGIGAGAHGKITLDNGRILRQVKYKHPRQYIEAPTPKIIQELTLKPKDHSLEFMMNAMRLMEPIAFDLFETRTQQSRLNIIDKLSLCKRHQLLEYNQYAFWATEKGHRYLNDLLCLFSEATKSK